MSLALPSTRGRARHILPVAAFGHAALRAGHEVLVAARRHHQANGEETSAMADARITEGELAELVGRTEEATSAYMRGDTGRYLAPTRHARGFTLMKPTGGAPARYEDRSAELKAWTSDFRAGESKLEVTQAHAWDDTVVLVMIERQHGQVGDLPGQDWSLRVTQVYRRDASGWQLVHRHADPLVHPIDLAQWTALVRG